MAYPPFQERVIEIVKPTAILHEASIHKNKVEHKYPGYKEYYERIKSWRKSMEYPFHLQI